MFKLLFRRKHKGNDTSIKTSNNNKWDNKPEPIPDLRSHSVMQLTKTHLPKVIWDYASDRSYCLDRCAVDMIAIPLVISAATAIGNAVMLTPKKFDKEWAIFPTLWGAVVAPPGSKKSPAISAGMAPLKRAIKTFNQQSKHKDHRNIIINDATVEAIYIFLTENSFGALYERDEISALLSRVSKKEFEHERAFYLESHNGNGDFSSIRVGRSKAEFTRGFLNLFGGIQPNKLQPYLQAREKGHLDDGFLERFQLLIMPNSDTEEYTDQAPSLEAKKQIVDVYRKLLSLQEYYLKYNEPLELTFDCAAQEIWTNWNKHWTEVKKDSEPKWGGVLSKTPALIGKLSLVFHLVEQAALHSCEESVFKPSLEVSKANLVRALSWLDYLNSHQIKIFGYDQADSYEHARALIERLSCLPSQFDRRTLQRKGWAKLSKSEQINSALELAEQHGYIRKIKTTNKQSNRESVKYEIHSSFTC